MNGAPALQGRHAVVTGAANGIGRACALDLAAAGADLTLLDIEEQSLDQVRAAIEGVGRRAFALLADCTVAARVEAGFQEAREALGPVDILVNNIGQSARERAGEFWQSEEETWRFVLEISLLSTLRCSRRVVPEMRRRQTGRIVNIASDAALVGDAGLADYASAKMGVIGFTRSLARELAPHGVTVNAVCPGAIRTRAHDRLPSAVLERVRAGVPMAYIAEPEDVAYLVTFLAGPGARYITGQSILVDGGRWML